MTKDKKGGNKEGMLIYEMATLPKWKLIIVIAMLNLHLIYIVKFYLKH